MGATVLTFDQNEDEEVYPDGEGGCVENVATQHRRHMTLLKRIFVSNHVMMGSQGAGEKVHRIDFFSLISKKLIFENNYPEDFNIFVFKEGLCISSLCI